MRHAAMLAAAMAVCAAALWLAAAGASAYVSIRVPTGQPGQALPVRWDLSNAAGRPNVASRRVRYEISDAGCADRAGFQGPINEFEAVQNSFSVWRNITESEIDFEFAGAATGAATNAGDNRNLVHWVGGNIATGVFAVTITTFEVSTGHITDVDMELNDRDYTWDTVGPGATLGRVGRTIVENVVTHEIGHLVGLDHAANARASLFFQSGPGLINSMSLEADDIAAVVNDYPSPDFSDPRAGTVQGLVDNGTSPQFGVEVLLLDIVNGRNVIGSITEGSQGPFTPGTFEINGVPPGNYAALAWPTNRNALGAYYSTAFINFYPVLRGLALGAIGAPNLVRVGPGGTVSGVNVSVPALPALLPGGVDAVFEPDNSSATAKAITNGQAAIARIQPSADQDWFKFTTTQPGRQVRVRVMADAMGSSLNPTLTMYAPNGTTELVSPVFGDPAFVPGARNIDDNAFDASGVNFDAEIVRVMATADTYFVKVNSLGGVTSGAYLFFVEIEGEDTAVDTNACAITANTSGVAAGGAGFTVTVTPRNVFRRDLSGPFTVDLVDATATPVVLDTIAGSAPFTFNVPAQSTPQVVRFSARVGGNAISESVRVSHFGALSAANSRVRALEKSVSANGYDVVQVQIEARDTGNIPFRDPAAAVLASTTLGTLDNGATTGASAVPAVFDPGLGLWRISLVAPTVPGTATISATINGNAVAPSAAVLALERASGTGQQPLAPPAPKKDNSCGATPVTGGVPIMLALALLRRRRNS